MLIGLFLYVNYRSNTFINIVFDDYLKLENNIILSNQFINNWGFDLMWSISFMLALSCFFKLKISATVVLIISILLEYLQLYNSNVGTFDVLDVVFEIVGVIIAIVINCFVERRCKL